jgi:GNAT superfamily N-acetyltransferase
MHADIFLRTAVPEDIPALIALIRESGRALGARDDDREALEAASQQALGVDRQLIADGTYFVAEIAGRIVGCGGWSRRKPIYGLPDQASEEEAHYPNRATDLAQIRPFYIHSLWARRGIGRRLIQACEEAAQEAGFTRLELLATLAGEPLYAACGYVAVARLEVALPGGRTLDGVRMTKFLSGDPHSAARRVA